MATISHEPPEALQRQQLPAPRLAVRDMWPSLAIAVMWFAVVLDAMFGPDIVSNNASGNTTIPSAVVVALFAYLGTRVVARYGFGPGRNRAD